MNIVKVVDASAIAALMFNESNSDQVASKLQDAKLIAPALLDLELANVCLNKIKRNLSRKDEFLQIFGAWSKLNIEHVFVDINATFALARATGLTAYDAAYLWVARTQNAELVTLDKQLAAAAGT